LTFGTTAKTDGTAENSAKLINFGPTKIKIEIEIEKPENEMACEWKRRASRRRRGPAFLRLTQTERNGHVGPVEVTSLQGERGRGSRTSVTTHSQQQTTALLGLPMAQFNFALEKTKTYSSHESKNGTCRKRLSSI